MVNSNVLLVQKKKESDEGEEEITRSHEFEHGHPWRQNGY
jgi:hypothetical protein